MSWENYAEPPPDQLDPYAWDDNVYDMPGADRHEEPRGASWKPLDLGPYLRGEVRPVTPTVGLARADGLQLLYPGLEHSVIGEMESGKSWFCAASAAAEITRGGRVVYVHFEDAIPTDVIGRLQALGIPDDAILEHLAFVGPHEPADRFALAALLDPAPALVILDGVNEGMSLHGQEIRNEDGAAAFRRVLVKPCTSVGAATLAADHVVKDRERRDRGPLGSIHKGNGLNGSLILLENAEPFGRGKRGRSHIFVTKDRPGHLRQNGRDTKLPGKTFMGSLIVDDTRTYVPYLDLAFLEPQDQGKTEEPSQTKEQTDNAEVLAAVEAIAKGGKQPSLRTVRATVSGMGNARIDNALARLVLADTLIETSGPNRSRLFTVAPGVPGVPSPDTTGSP